MSAVIAVDQGTTGSGMHVLHSDGAFQFGTLPKPDAVFVGGGTASRSSPPGRR